MFMGASAQMGLYASALQDEHELCDATAEECAWQL